MEESHQSECTDLGVVDSLDDLFSASKPIKPRRFDPRKGIEQFLHAGGSDDQTLLQKLVSKEVRAMTLTQRIDRFTRMSVGFPLARTAKAGQPQKLRELPRESKLKWSLLGGIYWVKTEELDKLDEDWMAKPWFSQMTLEPEVSPYEAKLGVQRRWPVWYKRPPSSREPTHIGVPRFLGMSLFGKPREDRRIAGEPMQEDATFTWGDSKPRPP